jgi:3-oxoacyl-[acyl-carrier protein] reductase
MMELGLKGRVALITGAGSQIGFGKGIAMALTREGCDIIVNDIDLEGAKRTAAEIEASGCRVIALRADVASSVEVNDMVRTALEQLGRIDILVNNAGVSNQPKPFIEMTEEEWDLNINTNLRGVLNCTRAVLPHMLARKSGKIINISSGVGKTGMPNGAVYAASKAGVIAFSYSLAKELISSGIYVNNIAPGIGDTNFLRSSNVPANFLEYALKAVPLGRATTPEDIGIMVSFLASDVSSDIVGQTFSVDGGALML